MATHTFRLEVADPITDEHANRLFDAGADDGYPETGPAGHSIGFDREAASLTDAVLNAIADTETAGLEVLRVEPDELVSAADIAERTGRSRQSVSALIAGDRGPGGWPRPIAGNVRSPLWRWTDIGAWFAAYDHSQQIDEHAATVLAAVNELLAARRALRRLEAPARERIGALVRT